MATHKDPAYLAEAAKLNIDVSPISGAEIRKLIDQIARTPAGSAQADREADLGLRAGTVPDQRCTVPR